jgi:hypothetical protein
MARIVHARHRDNSAVTYCRLQVRGPEHKLKAVDPEHFDTPAAVGKGARRCSNCLAALLGGRRNVHAIESLGAFRAAVNEAFRTALFVLAPCLLGLVLLSLITAEVLQ